MRALAIVLLLFVGNSAFAQQKTIKPFCLLVQGKDSIYLNEKATEYKIKKDSFTLYFAITPEPKDLSITAKVAFVNSKAVMNYTEAEASIAQIPYFAMGTGMAADAGVEQSYFSIDSQAHCYLYYTDANDYRMTQVDAKNNIYKWTVRNWLDRDADDRPEIPLNKFSAAKQLYLVVVIDHNDNYKVSQNEFWKAILNLED